MNRFCAKMAWRPATLSMLPVSSTVPVPELNTLTDVVVAVTVPVTVIATPFVAVDNACIVPAVTLPITVALLDVDNPAPAFPVTFPVTFTTPLVEIPAAVLLVPPVTVPVTLPDVPVKLMPSALVDVPPVTLPIIVNCEEAPVRRIPSLFPPANPPATLPVTVMFPVVCIIP